MKLLSILSILLLFIGCDVSKKNDNNEQNQQPEYEEFSTTNNTETETQNDIIEDAQDDIQFDLSTDNLNEFLASPEQTVIFSFNIVDNDKTLSLLTDANNNYLIYRFGKPDNIELQFPKTIDKKSWKEFTFESYTDNKNKSEHIVFINVDYQYSVYFNQDLTNNTSKVGVQVASLNNGKIITDVKGIVKSISGSFEFFKNTDLVN